MSMTPEEMSLVTAASLDWQQAIDFVPLGLSYQIASGYKNIPTWQCERLLDGLVAQGRLEQKDCMPGTPYWMRYFRLMTTFGISQ